MSSDVAAQLSARAESPTITPREKQVLQLMAQGMRNKEIADRLHVSEGTVKIHLHNMYEKLDVKGRTQLILSARDRGWEEGGTETAKRDAGDAPPGGERRLARFVRVRKRDVGFLCHCRHCLASREVKCEY